MFVSLRENQLTGTKLFNLHWFPIHSWHLFPIFYALPSNGSSRIEGSLPKFLMAEQLIYVDVIGNLLVHGDLALEALADTLANELSAPRQLEWDRLYTSLSNAVPRRVRTRLEQLCLKQAHNLKLPFQHLQ